MNLIRFICTLWIFLAVRWNWKFVCSQDKDFVCPADPNSIFPCTCVRQKHFVSCDGSKSTVGQETLKQTVLHLRTANNVSTTDWLHLVHFNVNSTNLTQLDLTPFIYVRMFRLSIWRNRYLARIVGPPLDLDGGLIQVQELLIHENPLLTDSGLGRTIKYFFHSSITRLKLTGNALRGFLPYNVSTTTSTKPGSHNSAEFLRGLANLTNLITFGLSHNKIHRIGGGQFQYNTKLQYLGLSHNQIMEIGENAFFFRKSGDQDVKNEGMRINLQHNLLNSSSFVSNQTGLERLYRQTHLELNNNRLETLPELIFKPMLDTPTNFLSIYLEGNPLICDDRMAWLKSREKDFYRFIHHTECLNNKNWTVFTSLRTQQDGDPNQSTDAEAGFEIAVSVGFPLSFLLLVMAGFWGWRHKTRNKYLRNLTATEIQDFRQGTSLRGILDPKNLIASIESQPFDPDLEISPDRIDLGEKEILGSGQFGIVYKGFLAMTEEGSRSGEKENCKQLVAVKTVKPGVDVETFKTLLSEIKIMAFLGKHPNVIFLLGASTTRIKIREALAVVEFCAHGDLRNYLKKHRDSFKNLFLSPPEQPTQQCQQLLQSRHEKNYDEKERPQILSSLDLLKFALGVANGMKFLTIKNVIHGDLAARNILLTATMGVKISDFGFSRRLIDYTNYVKKTKVPLPFRWLSIEALKDRNFSIKSDVWAFGVLLYEIFSLGEVPYPETACWDRHFLDRLTKGYRMPAPAFANSQIYELMLATWAHAPKDRPSFELLHGQIAEMTSEFQSLNQVYYTPV